MNNEYMREYMLKRYHKQRNEAISALGGKCCKCGAVDELELDHINPKEKTFDISVSWSTSPDKFQEELRKCQVLCRKCHSEKSVLDAGKIQVKGKDVHGTLSSYRYCKCALCKAAKKASNRMYKKKRKSV